MADAITISSDMKIYEAEFNAGVYEALYQNSNIFNAATNNAIRMFTQVHQGNYLKNAYFKQISSLVTRQDITSISAVDSKKLEQAEEVGVKLHRKIGPVQYARKSFKMAGLETPEGSMALGRLVGDAVLQRMASDAIIALKGAITSVSALQNDITGEATPTANFSALNNTRLKFGDQLAQLRAWLSHSKPFGNVVGDGLSNYSFDSVAGALVARGNLPGYFNAPVIVSDNSNLKNSTPTPAEYYTFGLKEMAVTVLQSELQEIVIRNVTGLEQLTIEIQGEYANTVLVDGFAWNTSAGGSNPSDSTLATTTNWTQVRTDTVGLGGVVMVSQ